MEENNKTHIARCYITVKNKKILWSEIDLNTGESTIYLSDKEAEEYEKQIMNNIGSNMSRYIANNPESALWDITKNTAD